MEHTVRRPLAVWNPARDVWENPDQVSLLCEHSAVYSETWPRSGMTRNGRAFEHQTSVLLTTADAFSYSPAAATSRSGASRSEVPGQMVMLPTPEAKLAHSGPDYARANRQGSGGHDLTTAVHLLPTPVASPSGNTPENHLRKKPGRQVVTDLAIVVENGLLATGGRVLPTPRAANGMERNQTIYSRPMDQPQNLENALAVLLPTPLTTDSHHSSPGDMRRKTPGLRSVAQMLPTPSANLGTNGGAQHPKTRRAGGHQPSIEDVAVFLLPTPTTSPETGNGHARNLGTEVKVLQTPTTADANGTHETRGGARSDELLLPGEAVHMADGWGEYGPAIARWESVIGRPAPSPTEVSPRGKRRLSPAFTEWMMGLPDGWVTGVNITRAEQLKACGNGVVPQQAAAALSRMLDRFERTTP